MYVDEVSLICDFAETYHIYDYRSLSVEMAAALFVGLRADSRIKMKLSGLKYDIRTLLLAGILDVVSGLASWKDRPKSILKTMLGETEEEDNSDAFDTPEEFWKAWNKA